MCVGFECHGFDLRVTFVSGSCQNVFKCHISEMFLVYKWTIVVYVILNHYYCNYHLDPGIKEFFIITTQAILALVEVCSLQVFLFFQTTN